MDKKIISVINQKRGAEKTTTVINRAAGLPMRGKISNLRKKNG